MITTPALTDPGSPQVTTITVPDTILDTVTLLIPGGHAFLTGFALSLAGQQLLPWPTDFPWIVGDNDRLLFEMAIEVDGPLDITTYNVDLYDHTHWLRLKLDDIDLGNAPRAPLPLVVTPA